MWNTRTHCTTGGVGAASCAHHGVSAPPVGRASSADSKPGRLLRRFVILIAMLATLGGFSATVASAAVLNVDLAGSGTGKVASNPAGINCSNVPGDTQTACSYDYGFFFGTGTLTATPGPGSAFLAWSGDAGGTCAGATNPCVTGFLFLGVLSATATFAPAPDPPAVTTGGASGVAFPSATVVGTVNPDNVDFGIRDCHFEYGPTTAYGSTAKCDPSTIGPGTSPVAVSASIGVLEPGQTYHYRLVASNGGGTGYGPDQTFRSDEAPADSCPNAPIREEQGALAQRLPDCGAYELVSPSFTGGQSATPWVGTADGNQATINSAGGFADTPNLNDSSIRYATKRTEVGWRTTAIVPPASRFPFLPSSALDWTRDNGRSLWVANLRADEGTKRYTPVVREPDGTFHVAGLTQDENQDAGSLTYEPVATTEDLLTVAQQTRGRPTLSDATSDSRVTTAKSLYTSTYRPDGTLAVRQIAYRGGATMFPSCDVTLGANGGSVRNAISRDGEKVFFTAACPDPDAQRVWAKVGNDDPIDLSASHCPAVCGPVAPVTFRGASRDGSRVYFTTQQRLLPDDPDDNDSPSADLYEYDFGATGTKLRLVTGGSGTDGAALWSVMRISDDGAYVYFIARGRALAGANARGDSPQPGSLNLYVFHRAAGSASGTTTFVGGMGGFDDYNPSGQASSSGRFFLFQTAANLTGEKLAGDAYRDFYRYDARDDDLRRVWTDDPKHNGTQRVGGTELQVFPESAGGIPGGGMQIGSGWYTALQISDDGSKVGFTTSEPLGRDDHNDRNDAYLWNADNGRIDLLTDGTSAPGNRLTGSQFSGMTPSGDSLFVSSASPLLREHTSGQIAAYVIRRNGGFPAPPAPRGPCVDDGCQLPRQEPPVLGGSAGSSTFAGPGNLLTAPTSTATVRVGKVGSVRGSSTRVSVKVSGKGKIQVSGTNLVRTTASASKAGSFRVVAKLSRSGKRVLRQKGRVKTRATVRFAPESGKAVRARVSLTFTAKSKKKSAAKASPRATRELSVLSSDVQKGR